MRSARLVPLVALLIALFAAMFAAPASAPASSNGNLPESALSPIAITTKCAKPEGQLANRAAAGFNAMAVAAGQQLPITGCDSAYRPYDRQVYYYHYWCSLGQCGNAAVPGTSNHGLGHAIDVTQWLRGYIDAHGAAFGWAKYCSDAPQEWWHILYCTGKYTGPNPGTHLHSPVLRNGAGGPLSPWVRKAQKLLRAHGDTHIAVDGSYGAHTHLAVAQFQRAEKLKATGVVNHATWKSLRAPVLHKPQPVVKPPTVHQHHGHHHQHHKPKPHHHHQHKPRGPPAGKPSRKPVTGVDASENNGSVNWQAVHAAGYTFAIVKATEGQDYTDKYFNAARLDAIRKAGLIPGVYHFIRPQAGRPGSLEARFFIQTIAHAGYSKGMLAPVLDLETTTLDASGTCHYAHSFIHRVRHQLHVKPIIYTYPGFGQSYLAGCSWMARYPLWIANYGVSSPTVPPPWKSYVAWQRTGSGSAPGFNGLVDLSIAPHGIASLIYNGGPAKLRKAPAAPVNKPLLVTPAKKAKLAQQAPTPPPPAAKTPTELPDRNALVAQDLKNLILDLIGAPR